MWRGREGGRVGDREGEYKKKEKEDTAAESFSSPAYSREEKRNRSPYYSKRKDEERHL